MIGRGQWIAFLAILALLLAGAEAFGSAAQSSLDALVHAADATANLPLLGPIDEAGRNGWDCKPERSAQSPALSDAGVSSPTR